MKANKIKGYKACYWNVCRNQSYAEGYTYEISALQPKMCARGFHFCEYPRNVLRYYRINFGFRLMEVEGEICKIKGDKTVSKILTVNKILTEKDSLEFLEAKAGESFEFDDLDRIVTREGGLYDDAKVFYTKKSARLSYKKWTQLNKVVNFNEHSQPVEVAYGNESSDLVLNFAYDSEGREKDGKNVGIHLDF